MRRDPPPDSSRPSSGSAAPSGSPLVTVFGTATRHAHGSPTEILTEGSARAFGAGSLIALAALVLSAFVITGTTRERDV